MKGARRFVSEEGGLFLIDVCKQTSERVGLLPIEEIVYRVSYNVGGREFKRSQLRDK